MHCVKSIVKEDGVITMFIIFLNHLNIFLYDIYFIIKILIIVINYNLQIFYY